MKINKNLVRILTISLLFIIITMPLVQAVEINTNSYNPTLYLAPDDTETILNIGGKLWGAFSAIGVVVAVIALAVIGLRSVFGSLEDKAAYKKAMLPYIVGLCLVAGISTVMYVVYTFAEEIDVQGTSQETASQRKCSRCGSGLTGQEIYNGKCNQCDQSI